MRILLIFLFLSGKIGAGEPDILRKLNERLPNEGAPIEKIVAEIKILRAAVGEGVVTQTCEMQAKNGFRSWKTAKIDLRSSVVIWEEGSFVKDGKKVVHPPIWGFSPQGFYTSDNDAQKKWTRVETQAVRLGGRAEPHAQFGGLSVMDIGRLEQILTHVHPLIESARRVENIDQMLAKLQGARAAKNVETIGNLLNLRASTEAFGKTRGGTFSYSDAVSTWNGNADQRGLFVNLAVEFGDGRRITVINQFDPEESVSLIIAPEQGDGKRSSEPVYGFALQSAKGNIAVKLVLEGSSAHKQGIREGDHIVRFENESLQGQSIEVVLSRFAATDKARLTVRGADGTEREVIVEKRMLESDRGK